MLWVLDSLFNGQIVEAEIIVPGLEATGHGFESAVFTKALHPPDRRTDADLKLFGRLPLGSSLFHEVDHARSQLTRIRSMHWPALRRINALDSHLPRVLGIPIHCGRDVL